MALEKYRQKRDFTRSPEPAGDTPHKSPKGKAARFFWSTLTRRETSRAALASRDSVRLAGPPTRR